MKRTQRPEPPAPIRINRYLSMCGVASRRRADDLVRGGKVVIDGNVVTEVGTKVFPGRTKVFVDGKQVLRVHEYLYLVLNKPKDTITTLNDERGRKTVMSLVKVKQRVYPVGRLDRNTTGVLLFTNDGEFAHRLMHPKFEIQKAYQVVLDRPVTKEHLENLRRGIRLPDGPTAPAQVYLLPGGRGREVGIIIHEGRNREVRNMFETLGYEVVKLDRVAYGPITKEGLPRGAMRILTRAEVRKLGELAGVERQFTSV